MKVEYYKNGEIKSFEGSVEEFQSVNSMFTCTIHETDLDLTGEKTAEWSPEMGKEAKWVAVDQDRSVWTYKNKPKIDGDGWVDFNDPESGLNDVTEVAHWAEHFHWQDSLHRVV